MVKRIVAFALFALMAIGVWAETEVVDGITWTYTVSNGEASVGGDNNTAIPTSTTGAITIPSKLGGYSVTSIGDYAFSFCSGLTSVTIPDSVTSIGHAAFSYCSGLTSVTIPDSVTSIGNSAFEFCTSLTGVTMSNSVTNIGIHAFAGVPPYEIGICKMIWSGAQDFVSSYDLADTPADRAIASVVVDDDCAIDSFVLKDGKVYDSVLYVNNVASRPVTLTLPGGYVYKAMKGAKPLVIPAASQCMLSITRIADNVFLVTRQELETIE